MSDDEIIDKAVAMAQEQARREGLSTGQTVTHPKESITYELIEIRESLGIVGLSASDSPTGEAVRKELPLDELFDPNAASRFVIDIVAENAFCNQN